MDAIQRISDLYQAMYHDSGNSSNVTVSCDMLIDDVTFYWIILIPAFLIVISLAFTKPRKRLCLGCCHRRPGLVYPMDALTRESRISYAAAFGATAFLIYQIIFDGRRAFEFYGPSQLNGLVSIASMVIYGTCYFPIFACLAVECIYGYGIGTLYVWTFVVKEILETFQCDLVLEARLLGIARNLPHIVCLLYLAISFPIRFALAIRDRKNIIMASDDVKEVTMFEEIKNSYQGIHVRRLLKRTLPPPPAPVGKKEKVQRLCGRLVRRVFYFRIDNFRYPARLLSVLLIGVFLLYMFAVELLGSILPLFDLAVYLIDQQLQFIGYVAEAAEPEEIDDLRFFFYLAFDLVETLKACFITSVVLALVFGLLNILHMLSSFRINLLNVYKGNNKHIPPMKCRSNASLLIGFIRYAGYQVGYIAWGFLIQLTVIGLVIVALATIIMILKYGVTDWLVDLLVKYWPVAVIAIVVNVVQILMAKFVFLQSRGGIFALDNRRFLFVFTYYMFFYNIFLGLVSCLLRIIKAIAIGTFMMPRLDNSTLPRRFQFFDPGFAAYVGYIHVEGAQTHPVLLVFLRLLRVCALETRRKAALAKGQVNPVFQGSDNNLELGSSPGRQLRDRKRLAALFNWQVAYTLINNPQIRLYRKGYLQNRSRLIKQGKFQKMSDMPMFSQDVNFGSKSNELPANGSANVKGNTYGVDCSESTEL